MHSAPFSTEASIYVIVDADATEARGASMSEVIRGVGLARPRLVQFRAKHRSSRWALPLLHELRAATRLSGTLLFVNDRPDWARVAGCDGVHVGQDDLSVSAIRQHFPDLLVGVSTHDQAQVSAAVEERPDYLAFGPIFETASKERPDAVVGVEQLQRVGEKVHAAGLSCVAIGGITADNIDQVAGASDFQAVISSLLPEQEPVTGESIQDRIRELERVRRNSQRPG